MLDMMLSLLGEQILSLSVLSLVRELITEVHIIEKLIENGDLKSLNKFIELLFSHGVISREKYKRLVLEITQITSLQGEELRKVANKLAKQLVEMISEVHTDEKLLAFLHKQVKILYASGVISEEKYEKLMLEIARIARLQGEELKNAANKFLRQLKNFRKQKA